MPPAEDELGRPVAVPRGQPPYGDQRSTVDLGASRARHVHHSHGLMRWACSCNWLCRGDWNSLKLVSSRSRDRRTTRSVLGEQCC
jgi:hypothetical protein